MSLHSFNLSKPFQPCPAPSNQRLPFAIDEMDFSGWLDTLTYTDDMEKCQRIFQVLQTLNNAYSPERKVIPGRMRLFFFGKTGFSADIDYGNVKPLPEHSRLAS